MIVFYLKKKEKRLSQNTKAISALFVTVLLWASAFVGIRFAMNDFSAGGLALFRYLIASIVISIPFFKLKNKKKPTLNDLIYFFFLGLMGFAIYNIFLNEGERTVSAGVANFIISQMPIIVSIIAFFIFKERLAKIGIFGFIFSIFGILLIMLGENEHHLDLGVYYILIATITAAIYSASQKPILKKYHPIEVTTYAIWGGTLALLFYFPQMISDLKQSSIHADIAVIYMGIFPGAIAYALWCYGFKYYPATKASSFLYLTPFITIIMAWLLLDEAPHLIAVIGGLIALFGSVLVNRAKIH